MDQLAKDASLFWTKAFPEHLVVAIDFESVSTGCNRPPLSIGVYSAYSQMEYWMEAEGAVQDWPGIPVNINIDPTDPRDLRIFRLCLPRGLP